MEGHIRETKDAPPEADGSGAIPVHGINGVRVEEHGNCARDARVHETQGIHILMELSGCPPEVLGDLGLMEEALRQAAAAAQTTVLNLTCHRFSPTGVSGVAVVAESHLSLHTWPEKGYAAVDIYTCGRQVRPRAGCICLSRLLGAQEVRCSAWERGVVEDGAYGHRQVDIEPWTI